MKFILMMNAPRGTGDWSVMNWAPEDLKAHIGFMRRLNEDLRKEGAFVAGEGLAPPGQAGRLVDQRGTPGDVDLAG